MFFSASYRGKQDMKIRLENTVLAVSALVASSAFAFTTPLGNTSFSITSSAMPVSCYPKAALIRLVGHAKATEAFATTVNARYVCGTVVCFAQTYVFPYNAPCKFIPMGFIEQEEPLYVPEKLYRPAKDEAHRSSHAGGRTSKAHR